MKKTTIVFDYINFQVIHDHEKIIDVRDERNRNQSVLNREVLLKIVENLHCELFGRIEPDLNICALPCEEDEEKILISIIEYCPERDEDEEKEFIAKKSDFIRYAITETIKFSVENNNLIAEIFYRPETRFDGLGEIFSFGEKCELLSKKVFSIEELKKSETIF